MQRALDLTLSPKTRRKLKRPLGVLIEDLDEDVVRSLAKDPFVTVGDRVTETFCDLGLAPKLEIVDSREKRKERPPPAGCYQLLITVKNPPGRITWQAIKAIKESLNQNLRVRILVEGEEDLLALPCIFFGPDGLRVFYGQPEKGIVYVDVNERTRKRAGRLLTEMGMSRAYK